jgi:cysteine-rich repeat protein
MSTDTIVCLVAALALGCNADPALQASSQALLSPAPDSLATDGVCSLREAWRESAGIPSSDCFEGSTIVLSAGTYAFALANPAPVTTEDTVSAVGDLDITGNASIVLQGAGMDVTVLDGADLDRLIHVKGNASLTLRDITLRNGTVNGGNGTTATPGSEPIGGLVYCNSSATCLFERVHFQGGVARNGGAVGVCSAVQGSYTFRSCVFDSNAATQAGGAVQGHVDASFESCTFSANSAGALGGALQWYDRTATLLDSSVTENTAALAGGGWAAVGQWNASTSGRIEQLGGALWGNSAGQKGGNAYVGAIGAQGQGGLYSAPCSAVGCTGSFTSLAVSAGSAPSGPDCSGFLDLFGSTVGNASGCSLVLHDPPVCGDGMVNAGEQCDDGNTEDGDQCSGACQAESCLQWGTP